MQAEADVNMPNKEGFTPLMLVAENGHDKSIKVLIKAGADVNKLSNGSWTALMYAAQKGHDKCLEALIQARAAVNSDNRYYTPLIMCSKQWS